MDEQALLAVDNRDLAIPAEPSLEMDIPPAKQDQPCASGQHHPPSPMFTVIECKGCIKTLEGKLEELVSSTHKIMEKNGVEVSTLCITVANPPISFRDEIMKLLPIPEITRATSLLEVFMCLSGRCWNYLDFDLLQHVVERYGDDKTKQMMKEYESEVKDFRKKTSVRVFWEANDRQPTIRPEEFPPNVKEYTIKRDWSPDSKTLEDIEELREETACKLYLYKPAIYMYRILPHSIEITFLVPSFVLEDQHVTALTGATQEITKHLQLEISPKSLSPEEEQRVLKQRPSVRNLGLLKYEEYGQRRKLSIVDEIAAQPDGWQNLARNGLDMPGISTFIGMIAARNSSDTKKCTTDLLDQWRRSWKNPTWDSLIEALDDAGFMVLAGDIRHVLPIATNIRYD